MRIDELKPGTGIHCKTEEEALSLFRELRSLEYRWNNGEIIRDSHVDILFDNYHDEGSNYYIDPMIYGRKHSISHGSYWHYKSHIEDYWDIDKVVEFSELELGDGEELDIEADEPFSLSDLLTGGTDVR